MKFLCLLMALSMLSGQVAPDDTIRVNVNLIQLDVKVTDKSGRDVPDLSVSDFEVLRDGKRQTIDKVLYVSGQRPGAARVGPALAGLPVAALPSVQPRRQDIRRTIAIYIDDLSLSMESIDRAKNALKKFIEEHIQPGDFVALYRSSSGVGMLQQFTTDKRQLLVAVDRTGFRNRNAVDSLAPVDDERMEQSDNPTLAQQAMEMRLREDIQRRERQDLLTAGMLATARFVVKGLQELPGRKSLILFSESLQMIDQPRGMTNSGMSAEMRMMPGMSGGIRQRTLQSLEGLIDAANRAGVVLYPIDPRGLSVNGMTAADKPSSEPFRALSQMQERRNDFLSSQDGMLMLADQTGGVFYGNTNDIGAALKGALDDQEGYYLISFRPDDATFEKAKGEAKFHKFSVKVNRSGLKLRYRKGFYGEPDQEADRTSSSNLVTSMTSPFRATEVGLKVSPIYYDDATEGAKIRALLHIDASNFTYKEVPADAGDKNQAPWFETSIDQLVMLYDESGQRAESVGKMHTIKSRGSAFEKLKQGGLRQEVEVPVKRPGAYQLRAAIMDQSSKRTGSSMHFIEIPDLRNKRLAMSDLVLSVSDWETNGQPQSGPTQRIFKPGAKLAYGGFIYNAKVNQGKKNADLETQIVLYREGKQIYTGTLTPFRPEFAPDSSYSLIGSVQLGPGTQAGGYVLQVAIRDLNAPKKQQFFVRSVDFEVRP
ncbi:VWA domain-containing protein [Bryobacter aggregatus]|uniref:VWA domain-containing protein n=1 Tax=Bryobacter aggregatus TaxID=360054 RepID=UPI0004E19F4F|nr:VWA domain-containing protein [Bryobacter aggregatus]